MPEKTACIACGYPAAYPIYHPGDQPLAALNLPKTQAEALQAARYPLDFHACARCGHIYNVAFDYGLVPYADDSNLMYNHGSGWQSYIQELIARLHKKYDFSGQTVIEIGCGDGHFLASLREAIPSLRCIGFEPGIDAQAPRHDGVEVHKDYFIAERDLPQYRPGLLICRHVLEHLAAPRDFIADIGYWCNMHGQVPYVLAEVPRIENAIAESRMNDYLYEHVSNFTDASFRLMFESAGYDLLEYDTAYRGEVLVTLARPQKSQQMHAVKSAAADYRQALLAQRDVVHGALQTWRKAGKRIAFWGGTGKSAAFLNGFSIGCEEYPTVVDSDPHKLGRFVPGMGQELRPPDYLLDHPVDIIVITTQWRAADIVEEIKRRGIAGELYTVRRGALEKLARG